MTSIEHDNDASLAAQRHIIDGITLGALD